MPDRKTIHARICVAVGDRGGWVAAGWTGATDSDAMRVAVGPNCGGANVVYHWINADFPIPDRTAEAAAEFPDGWAITKAGWAGCSNRLMIRSPQKDRLYNADEARELAAWLTKMADRAEAAQ